GDGAVKPMRRAVLFLAAIRALAAAGGGPAFLSADASVPPPPAAVSQGPQMIGTASRPTGEALPLQERFVDQGISVEVTVQPVDPTRRELREGDEAVFRFRITDAATGNPLAGSYPAGWMDLTAPGVEPETSCKHKVETFVEGSLFTRPEVNLNSYQVLALNEDATISVVDPLFGFGGSKLLAMLFLDSPGEDWALAADKKR